MIDEAPDRRRIRLGLAFLAAVVVISLAMGFVVEAPVAKLVMFGIALFTIARTFILVRSVRRGS